MPIYHRAEADKKLEEDLKYLEHFNMPAWNLILEKLVHVDKDDCLQVAMEQLIARKVYSPRPHRVCLELYPEVFKSFKPPPEIDHITMDGMVQVLIDIIYKAKKWENGARGSESTRKALERTAEMPHVSKLYEQD